jgi:hypothetical protein
MHGSQLVTEPRLQAKHESVQLFRLGKEEGLAGRRNGKRDFLFFIEYCCTCGKKCCGLRRAEVTSA